MRSSSARQQEFDFSNVESSSVTERKVDDRADIPAHTADAPTSSASIASSFPSFGVHSDLYALASRRAGRLNASSISQNECDALLRERQILLDKKFNETITRAETIRLEYVRWQLDRIEDAKHGEAMDALENWVSQYERFQVEVERLEKQLSENLKGKRR